jgi:hypothetical protein
VVGKLWETTAAVCCLAFRSRVRHRITASPLRPSGLISQRRVTLIMMAAMTRMNIHFIGYECRTVNGKLIAGRMAVRLLVG